MVIHWVSNPRALSQWESNPWSTISHSNDPSLTAWQDTKVAYGPKPLPNILMVIKEINGYKWGYHSINFNKCGHNWLTTGKGPQLSVHLRKCSPNFCIGKSQSLANKAHSSHHRRWWWLITPLGSFRVDFVGVGPLFDEFLRAKSAIRWFKAQCPKKRRTQTISDDIWTMVMTMIN